MNRNRHKKSSEKDKTLERIILITAITNLIATVIELIKNLLN